MPLYILQNPLGPHKCKITFLLIVLGASYLSWVTESKTILIILQFTHLIGKSTNGLST